MNYKAYVCRTDWLYHFPDDWHGVNIYFSEKSIKTHRKCIKECGIEKVVVVSEKEYDKLQEELEILRRNLKSVLSEGSSHDTAEECVNDLFDSIKKDKDEEI